MPGDGAAVGVTVVTAAVLEGGTAVGVTATVIAVVTAMILLALRVEDETAEEIAGEGYCKGDVIDVCSVAVETNFEELVAAAVTVFSKVGVLLSLSSVILLITHCPTYAQYCPRAQQIGPHDVSPSPPSQANDVAAATAVLEVGTEIKVAGAEVGRTDDDDGTDDSEVDGTSARSMMENLLGDALQQSVPPLSSGRFVSQQ